MATSIGKLSKSFLVKILVGIIILPFVFWGMGDVFRGGNQNVIATIDSKKISAQEFIAYLNQLNLDKDQIKNFSKTNLFDQILAEYIGKKVMDLEIKQLKITVNDNALRNIIKNEKLFFKNDKFSRTEYEKFLLKSGVTAPAFEENIEKQESKRQMLSSLSGGIVIPHELVIKAFNKENQIKTIKYIDLEKYYLSKKPSQEEIKKLYEKRKNIFIEEFKSIQYAEITPKSVTGNEDYDETFFKNLDDIENKILDGQSFNEAINQNNLKPVIIENININKLDKNKKEVENLSDSFFQKIYSIKNEKVPEIINAENKYFLVEIKSIDKKIRLMNDPQVLKALNLQLNFQNKIKSNTSLIKDISLGGFNKIKMESFAKENNLEIRDYKISNLKQNEIFTEGIIKRIFLVNNDEVNLITNSELTDNFLVLSVKTEFKKLKKDSNDYEKYEAKARLNLVNKIYETYDKSLNQKYKVELNKKTIERVKNSF